MKHLAWLALALPLACPELHRGAMSRPGVDVYFSPDGGVQKAIVDQIGAAKKSVDVAVFTFTAEPIARALVDARKQNDKLQVRVITDWYQYHEMGRDVVKLLRDGGIDVRLVDLGNGNRKTDQPHFHHKFAVIDGETVLTGSYNWTVQAEEKNHENLIVLKGDKKTAQSYVQKFKETWDSKWAKKVPE